MTQQPAPEWPVLLMEFAAPPTDSDWDVLAAQAETLLPILGFEEEPPDRAEGTGPGRVRFFLPAGDAPGAPQQAAATLRELALLRFKPTEFSITVQMLPDRNWGEEWREHFHLMHIGKRLYVGPPWEKDLPEDAPADALHIFIEPGQAFGTGSHETTRLCLRVLEELVRPETSLLDAGTGSGILSIAAVKLGATFATGVEYDPVCEENFHFNTALNGVAAKVRFVLSARPLEGVEACRREGHPLPNLIVCNMLSERFIPILPELAAPRLPLLLSGFLLSEEMAVREEVERHKLRIERSYVLDEWAAFLCAPAS